MYLLLIILIVIAALLMCFIVLIQNSKGGGLASSFASSNQIMGVRKTTDFLEKTTWGLAAFIVVLCIATSYTLPKANVGGGIIMEQAQQEEKTNPMNLPDFPAPTETPSTETPAETPVEPTAE
ncbi:preprotein translocase subunit SecG [Bacteroides sp. 519]|uniref:preprotein translocase subunit SecG n=1 Tax=Bacteroides sp. 519 TaxID=2302937 RepID=UPI0013D81D71|nr:preprotein translocase subunit SecG [Bacteroides sp. 519]NDV59159.1 preprotein translocase subunit SecG [Bacteroides sp. 519]